MKQYCVSQSTFLITLSVNLINCFCFRSEGINELYTITCLRMPTAFSPLFEEKRFTVSEEIIFYGARTFIPAKKPQETSKAITIILTI